MSDLLYTEVNAPELGQMIRLADNVYWSRMPVPFPPKHINVYFLEDSDGWYVVDTGMNLPEAKQLWQQMFERYFEDKPIKGVIATHMHIDHCGLAHFITNHWRVRLWMTQGEYFAARSHAQRSYSWQLEQHYARAGMEEGFYQKVTKGFEPMEKLREPLPMAFERLSAQTLLSINGREWKVIIGHGHSPEHASLYCDSLGVLISGDQVLPRISPNISVTGECPNDDPMSDYLDSLQPFLALPEKTLTLPAHGNPFHALHQRVHALLEDHDENLQAVMTACAEPQSIKQIIPQVFRRELSPIEYYLALGETQALVNRCWHQEKLSRTLSDQGIYLYARTSN
ncbi:MAG: MBL fold metallo-hydrolase [Cellvibrionaceae bacterium]